MAVTRRPVEITPALRDYVTAAFERIRRRFDQARPAREVPGAERRAQRVDAARVMVCLTLPEQAIATAPWMP